MTEKMENLKKEWDYSTVKLTLHNIILPMERLYPTPSMQENMDEETEMDLRILGCELIQTAGILLKLPQVAMATGQVLYQRFFYSKSFVRHSYLYNAEACVFLAAKIEECPRRLRDIINVFHHIKQINEQKPITPVILDNEYMSMKNQVIKAERRILKELGFCVHGKHPHKLIICYLQTLDQHQNKKLVQIAWNYMNDSLRTDVFVRYYPETIACSCIFLAARQLKVPLPSNPPWWRIFNVEEESIRTIGLSLLRLYARKKPDPVILEKKLTDLKKEVGAKMKSREHLGNAPLSSGLAGALSSGGAGSEGTPGSGKRATNRGGSPDERMNPVGSTNGGHDQRQEKEKTRRGASRSRSRTPKAYRRSRTRSRSRDRKKTSRHRHHHSRHRRHRRRHDRSRSAGSVTQSSSSSPDRTTKGKRQRARSPSPKSLLNGHPRGRKRERSRDRKRR